MQKRLKKVMGSLAGQFVLGMILNVSGDPTEISNHLLKNLYYLVLVLHVLNAIGLVVMSVLIFKEARNTKLANLSKLAILFTAIAFAGGMLTQGSKLTEFWSFVMAMGFLAAFQTYGRMAMAMAQGKN